MAKTATWINRGKGNLVDILTQQGRLMTTKEASMAMQDAGRKWAATPRQIWAQARKPRTDIRLVERISVNSMLRNNSHENWLIGLEGWDYESQYPYRALNRSEQA